MPVTTKMMSLLESVEFFSRLKKLLDIQASSKHSKQRTLDMAALFKDSRDFSGFWKELNHKTDVLANAIAAQEYMRTDDADFVAQVYMARGKAAYEKALKDAADADKILQNAESEEASVLRDLVLPAIDDALQQK